VALVAVALGTMLGSSSVRAQGWPDVFDPTQLRTLNLTMDPDDWETIRHDLTFDIEVPAQFWADGETAINVSVRRKSCDALPDEDNPFKVSLKIDINEYVGGQEWHGLNKLSLENGDDVDVVAEGLACNLHAMATDPVGYTYADSAHYANWVVLNVNGVSRGVYVSQEQRDKQFLQNRGLYIESETWSYKVVGRGVFELDVGDDENPISPALYALCYEPFTVTDILSPLYLGPPCAQPDDPTLVTQLNQWIDMQSMLAMYAVNSFVANPDALFNHYNNTFFLDFNMPSDPRKRMYFPWDQDSVMSSVDRDIYEATTDPTDYQLVLGNPTFRSQYNQIMRNLLDSVDGPLSETNIHAFLDTIETVLTTALGADPYNQFDTPGEVGVAERFAQIKTWYTDRIANVLAQVEFDEPTPPPGIILLQDGFEGTPWDGNWDDVAHNWLQETTIVARGLSAAHADDSNNGDFISDSVDTTYATTVHVDFWFHKDDMEATELQLYYYNGSTYNFIADLTTLGADDTWLNYTDAITDSQYIGSDFRIRLECTANKKGENAYVDAGRDRQLPQRRQPRSNQFGHR